MTTPEEIAQIAAGLTEAQRRALLWVPVEGWRERKRGDISQTPLYSLLKIIKGNPKKKPAMLMIFVESRNAAGKDKGSIWPNTEWSLTPLGRAVAQYLRSQGNG